MNNNDALARLEALASSTAKVAGRLLPTARQLSKERTETVVALFGWSTAASLGITLAYIDNFPLLTSSLLVGTISLCGLAGGILVTRLIPTFGARKAARLATLIKYQLAQVREDRKEVWAKLEGPSASDRKIREMLMLEYDRCVALEAQLQADLTTALRDNDSPTPARPVKPRVPKNGTPSEKDFSDTAEALRKSTEGASSPPKLSDGGLQDILGPIASNLETERPTPIPPSRNGSDFR